MMRLLTDEKKRLFVEKLLQLRQQLNAFKPENTLQSLELFENQLTLNEMESCFSNPDPDAINTHLRSLLSARWERVRNSNMCYTQQPGNLVNQLCLEIATEIAPPASTPSEIEALEPNTGPYCLLMPSLENSEDAFGTNIHALGLHEFVLSDNERVFIPLAQCLQQASVSDEGRFRQMVAIDGKYPELTPHEIERVSQHSTQANNLYQAVIALNKQRLLGDDIGAKLRQLASALRGGGVSALRDDGVQHSGNALHASELNAGSAANLGILAFSDYWNALSEQQKMMIFTETPQLKDVLGRLFRPDDANYKETRFCVELIANALDPIIEKYDEKPTLQILQGRVLKQADLFRESAQRPHGLAIIPKKIPPKHILHRIFKLEIDEQQLLFKQQGDKSALMYALAHEPEALLEFELDDESKQQAITARFNPDNSSALIIAAKRGKAEVIRLLLSWEAPIQSRDANNDSALHWAACYGHLDAVGCLLTYGASLLDAQGFLGDTALNVAIMYGKGAVVKRLLEANANVGIRNYNSQNALDIAIEKHPELIKTILMHIATLPLEAQAECLLTVPGGPYPSVLFYAQQADLFDELIEHVLQKNDLQSIDAIRNASNQKGSNALIYAARLGAHASIPKLLTLGLDIQSSDTNNDTALHWAAYNGHLDAVRCLLDKGASLEAQGFKNDTALHCAVEKGRGDVVKLLLKNNANVNARNNNGQNALDIAIEKKHPELIKTILMHIATLPLEAQAECLLTVPGGPYENVYTYVAIERPKLLNSLILKSSQPQTDAKLTAILTNMHFDEHLERIHTHYLQMKEKSRSNSNYIVAAAAAKTLLIDCAKAKIELFQNEATADVKIVTFKNACKQAIEKAKPILKKHREWGKVFAAFLLTIITFPVSLPLYAAGFFSVKTKSNQLLDKLHEDIDQTSSHDKPSSQGG